MQVPQLKRCVQNSLCIIKTDPNDTFAQQQQHQQITQKLFPFYQMYYSTHSPSETRQKYRGASVFIYKSICDTINNMCPYLPTEHEFSWTV